MTHTKIHLNEAFGQEDEKPTIAVSLYAHTDVGNKTAVSVEFGDPARGKFGVMITPRSARYLAHYLIAYADTADGVPVKEGDPTKDAPELTDKDAPEWVAA